MAKPNWKGAEEEFVSFFPKKTQYVFQFHDSRAAMGAMQSKRVFTTSHPSDFIVTDEGVTFYAEVKSSEDAVSFPFSNIKKSQWTAAIRMAAAKGLYYFFIRHDPVGIWYKIPAQVFIDQYNTGAKSMKWSLLLEYKWREEA